MEFQKKKLIYSSDSDRDNVINKTHLGKIELFGDFYQLLTQASNGRRHYISSYEEVSKISLKDLKLKIETNERDFEIISDLIKGKNKNPDFWDYAVAAYSGYLCGKMGCCISPEQAQANGTELVNNAVIMAAKIFGFEYKDEKKKLEEAVSFLEKKFHIASDKVTDKFGGGLQHHLRDWSHHASPIGLLSSILMEFTGMVCGTNTSGDLILEKVIPQGKNTEEKIYYGTIGWLCHIISDMAGSSDSIAREKMGTGIPGPILSFLKVMSASPIFSERDENGNKKFSVLLSKLFNGTIIPGFKLDLRGELGISMHILINECIVRGFYFVRTLLKEIESNTDEEGNIYWDHIDWKNTIRGETLDRMITVSTGVMTAYYSLNTNKYATQQTPFLLCVTAATGLRFAFAIGTEYVNWYEEQILSQKLISLQRERELLYMRYSEIIEFKNLILKTILSLVILALFIVVRKPPARQVVQ